MEVLLVLMLLAVTAAVGHAVGKRRGLRERSQDALTAAGVSADAYRSGYLAGHLDGWRDAEAKLRGSAVGPASAPPGTSRTSTAPPATHQAAPGLAAPHAVPPTPAPDAVSAKPVPAFIQSPMRLPAPAASTAVNQPVQRPYSPMQQPVHRETPEEAAARKEKRDQQNINVTLYVASLLLVAAGALFVGTSLPELFRFMGIWFITALFYGAGLVIHARVPRLRPAAVAFVGTGLALIPITGLAMYNFALHNGAAAWLVTSLLGTIVYAYTAVRLDNKILAFLSLSFVVSTAWSGVSVLGGALVWYFTAMIGVAILLTLAALRRPRWLPPLYIRPLMMLHPFVVPVVALAVTVTPAFLSGGEYALVMFMCGTYFTVMAFVPRALYRLQHVYAARLALTLALLGLVWEVSADVSTVMLAAVVCLGVQSLGVAFAGERLAPRTWWNDAVSCLGLQLVSSATLTVLLGVGQFDLSAYLPLFVSMLTAMLVGWKLGAGTEFAPGAVLAMTLPFVGLLGAWPVSVLLISAALSWFLRAAVQPSGRRHQLILAGRISLTLFVPAMTAGVFEDSPKRVAYALVAFIAAAALQQVASALLASRGVRLLAPQASVVGFGGAATAGLLILPVFDDVAGRPALVIAVLFVLAAGVASGLLLFPRTVKSAGAWRPGLAEFLAPATAFVAGVVAAAFVSLALGNVVLLATVTYFSVTALRIAPSFHRQCYWWLTRASGTLLAASAYADATRDGWGFRVAGEIPSTALVVIVAAALQVVLPLLAGSRRRFPQASIIDAGSVIAVMAIATTMLTVSAAVGEGLVGDGWQPGVAAVTTAVVAVVCGVVLRRHSAAWIFAPAALVLLMGLRVGNIRDVEILLGVFAAYSGFMAGVVHDRFVRGGYMLAARVLAAAFAAVVVADITDSPAAVSISISLVLLLQHAMTVLLRARTVDVAFQQASTWAVLGVQLVLPITHLFAGNFDGGGRWVVLFELALLLASAAIAWRVLDVRGSRYFGVAAVGAAVILAGPGVRFPSATWLHQPLLDKSQVPAVLLAIAVAFVVVRAFHGPREAVHGSAVHPADRWFWVVSSLALVLTGGLLTLDVSSSLTGLAALVFASVLFAVSHVERIPALYAAAAPSVLVGAVPAVNGVMEGLPPGVWSDYAAWLVGGLGTAAILYAVKSLGGWPIRSEVWRRNSLVGTAAVALACSAGVGMLHDETSLVGFVLVVAAGVLVVVEVPRGKSLAAELVALVSMAALQRALLFMEGSRPDWFWTAQWYVLAGAVLAGLRYMKQQRTDGLLRLCIAAGALSLTSLGTIFGGTPPQQLYVLVAHVVLLAAGLLLAERVLVWWGAAGVALSIMWALRSYAFAMLALVAVALIALAVWRLNRKPPGTNAGTTQGGDPGDAAPTRSQDVIR